MGFPYFAFDQAKKVLEVQQQAGKEAFYNEKEDLFIFNIDNEDEPEIYNPIEVRGQKLYPIGTFNWIWEEIK